MATATRENWPSVLVGAATVLIVLCSALASRGGYLPAPKIQPRGAAFGIAWFTIFAFSAAFAISPFLTNSAMPRINVHVLFAAALIVSSAWPFIRSRARTSLAVVAAAACLAAAAMLSTPSEVGWTYRVATELLAGWLVMASLLSIILVGATVFDTEMTLAAVGILVSLIALGFKKPFFCLPAVLALAAQKRFSKEALIGLIALILNGGFAFFRTTLK